MTHRLLSLGTTLLAGAFFLSPLYGEEHESKPPMLLKKDARLVMMGDSITEARGYSKVMELYLAACLPELDVHTLHLGWSGATIQKLQGRLTLLTLPYKPDIVTLCAGGADGGYGPYAPHVGENYLLHLNTIVDRLKSVGAKAVIVAPCTMDPHFATGKVYPESIMQLGELARKAAETQQMPFANVNGVMNEVMVKTKAAYGEDYSICGRDGIHPYANGALLIAYELLKAMGVDGNIGTITLDMKGTATSTEGHKVLSSENGKAEIESARYPFCFDRDEKAATSNRSILPFIPFNQDLNRFMLVVKNLDSEKATVTWGTASKVFTRKELESGVNLAEAFIENNPFLETFKKADAAVYAKQGLESDCKLVIEDINDLMDKDEESKKQLDEVRKKVDATLEKSHAEVRALLAPVKYTLSVTPQA